MKVTVGRALWVAAWAALLPGGAARGDDKVTYQDHVRPIFANHCLNCHNPDKRRGGLILATYLGVREGSSGGVVVVAGDPDQSRLFGVVNHTREPTMPLKQPKIADADIEVIRKWIVQGCLNTADDQPPASAAPSIAISVAAATPA
ncbi:MAG: hypothetical protein IID40_03370, partial [Planctomycetes bacterium]|nr:hypothetical protein [Planctomycetota bacterium]